MGKSAKKTLVLALKILLSLVLLWWVLRKIDWHQFLTAIHKIDYTFFLGAVLAFLLSVLAISYRWWRLVGIQQIAVSLWEATRLTFLGTFFNQIVLGTTGGDLVKAFYLSKHGAPKTTCLITVLVDRIIGMVGMTLLSALMLAVVFVAPGYFHSNGNSAEQLHKAAAVIGLILVLLVAGLLILLSQRIRRWVRLEKLYNRLPMAQALLHARQAVRQYRAHPMALGAAMWQTLVAQLLFVGAIALVGYSLSLQIPWYQYLIYIPLIYIVASVPIVPGGVGLVENLFVTFFAGWAGAGQVLALALLARLIPVFWALPGAVVAVRGAKIPSSDELREEMVRDDLPVEN